MVNRFVEMAAEAYDFKLPETIRTEELTKLLKEQVKDSSETFKILERAIWESETDIAAPRLRINPEWPALLLPYRDSPYGISTTGTTTNQIYHTGDVTYSAKKHLSEETTTGIIVDSPAESIIFNFSLDKDGNITKLEDENQ